MLATVTSLRSRQAPVAPDSEDTPVVARWLLARGWTALDAFHAGFPADLAALMLTIETAPS